MAVQLQCPNPDCSASFRPSDADPARPGQCPRCGQVVPPPGTRGPHATPAGDSEPVRTPSRPTELAAGATLGRYRIVKRLGQGGMGSVYLAEDTRLKRPVALKIPMFGPADGPEALERFDREAAAAATLEHPYLCPVYDVGEDGGVHYLAMAYIEGRSLAESLRGAGQPPRQAAALVGKLATAMQEAHARGVVHRDLKPANIMIKATGRRREPVIVDFGLAHRQDMQDGRVTKTGQVLGTLAYMAPEQLRGDPRGVGPACDIYALGVILYELLTGRLPFDGAGLAVVGQILTQPPLPPSQLRPDLDARLEIICLEAMSKEVKDRYATMGELAAALADYLRTAPSAAVSQASPGPMPAPGPAGEEPPSPGGDTLMAQLLDRVAAEQSSVSLLDRAPRPAVPGRWAIAVRRPPWPVLAGAVTLTAALLGIILLLQANKGTTQAPQAGTTSDAAARVDPDAAARADVEATPRATAEAEPAPRDRYAIRLEPSSQSRVLIPTLRYGGTVPITVEVLVEPKGQGPKSGAIIADTEFGGIELRIQENGTPGFMARCQGNYYVTARSTVNVIGRRVHLAGTFDGRRLVLFVDGKQAGTAELPRPYQKSPIPVCLGASPETGGGAANFFNGLIEQVRFSTGIRYDRDFVPDPRLLADDDTVLLYRFDQQPHGPTAIDLSDHGHNGLIIRAEWVRLDAPPGP